MRSMLLNGKIVAILAVLLILFMAVGVAEGERIDAGGQWKYVLEDGGATIKWCVEEPSGDLVIPDVLDGYVVRSIGDSLFLLCSNITSGTIGNNVTDLGACATPGKRFPTCCRSTGCTTSRGRRDFSHTRSDSLLSKILKGGV